MRAFGLRSVAPYPSRFSLRSRARPRKATEHWSHLVFARKASGMCEVADSRRARPADKRSSLPRVEQEISERGAGGGARDSLHARPAASTDHGSLRVSPRQSSGKCERDRSLSPRPAASSRPQRLRRSVPRSRAGLSAVLDRFAGHAPAVLGANGVGNRWACDAPHPPGPARKPRTPTQRVPRRTPPGPHPRRSSKPRARPTRRTRVTG